MPKQIWSIGSEISGGIENVHIWDTDISRSMYDGIEIKATRKRGGYVKNIKVENSKLPRLLIHKVKYNDDGDGAKSAPIFKDFLYNKIELTGKYLDTDGDKKTKKCAVIEIDGFDEMENIVFKDITIPKNAKIKINNANGISLENIITK